MRLKSVDHPVLADARVKAVRVQRVGTSPATSPERVIQVLAVQVLAGPPHEAQARVDQVQIDPRVLAGVAVDVQVADQDGPGVAPEANLGVAREANPQGSPEREQVANQGEAGLRARGKRCGLRGRPKIAV